MPATSKSQQRLFGMVHAYQKGKLKDAPESVRRIAESISKTDARHFAETKHDGLPERKEKMDDGRSEGRKVAEFAKSAFDAVGRLEANGYRIAAPASGRSSGYRILVGPGGAVGALPPGGSEKRAEDGWTDLTPYQFGFFLKCASLGRGRDESMSAYRLSGLAKSAAGIRWDSVPKVGPPSVPVFSAPVPPQAPAPSASPQPRRVAQPIMPWHVPATPAPSAPAAPVQRRGPAPLMLTSMPGPPAQAAQRAAEAEAAASRHRWDGTAGPPKFDTAEEEDARYRLGEMANPFTKFDQASVLARRHALDRDIASKELEKSTGGFDYGRAVIDTSKGNNGHSIVDPDFVFYKNEPKDMFEERRNRFIQGKLQRSQIKADATSKGIRERRQQQAAAGQQATAAGQQQAAAGQQAAAAGQQQNGKRWNNWWDNIRTFYDNNKDAIAGLGLTALGGGLINSAVNAFRPEEKRKSFLRSLLMGGLYGGLAYGGYRGMNYLDKNFNDGRVAKWLNGMTAGVV